MSVHIVLHFDGPLIAFGGEAIDNYGVIRPFPAKSMIAGLLANALGYERYEAARLQSLQDALVIGSRIETQGALLRDYQTAELSRDDAGWTTHGRIEKRGGAMGERQTHIRYRDYWTHCVTQTAVRLCDGCAHSCEEIREALLFPARPLFLGRKPCLPSELIWRDSIDAGTIYEALKRLTMKKAENTAYTKPVYWQWPANEGPQPGDSDFSDAMRLEQVCDERNWLSGVHGGHRLVRVLTEARPQHEKNAA